MLYDVVPIQTRYRGIGRCLDGADFYPNESKKEFSQLLDQYAQSLDQWQNPPSQQGLAKLMELCSLLRQFHFPCEVIVYDSAPLERAYGYGLEFLGVDVAHNLEESLLYGEVPNEAEEFLNEHGLCPRTEDVARILPLLDCDDDDKNWAPCYVYAVSIQRNTGPRDIPDIYRKPLQKDIMHLHFDSVYRDLSMVSYEFSFDHLSHDFPKVNSLTMYAFLMYVISQEESPDKHLTICNYLTFMEPTILGADTLIHWHLTRALELDPKNREVLRWILSVYDGNPDCPFSQAQLEEYRRTLKGTQTGGDNL